MMDLCIQRSKKCVRHDIGKLRVHTFPPQYVLTRVILINWSILINLLRKSLKQKIIQFILPILAYLSEFERFFKNSQNRKLQVLCAITFGGIATHLKVVVAFESQKFMFFTSKIVALSNPSKNMIFCDLKATITFRCVVMPPKVMAHSTSSFSNF